MRAREVAISARDRMRTWEGSKEEAWGMIRNEPDRKGFLSYLVCLKEEVLLQPVFKTPDDDVLVICYIWV
jgi:hypothetical protein